MSELKSTSLVRSPSFAYARSPTPSVVTVGDKHTFLDELLDLLRKLVDYCLCCLTCGCYPAGRKGSMSATEMYETELTEEERTAVTNLLSYLDSAKSKEPTINNERLRALCILTYSDNLELQRSAAYCFAELSERMRTSVAEIVLEPLVILLKSRDCQVQKASSLAISNFALHGPESNKTAIINSGALKPLIQLLHSDNVEVQCNTCGCITTLATTEKSKQEVVLSGGVRPLLELAKSDDIRVKRNATGALLNLTHLQSSRNELVHQGALPVLVDILHTSDTDVQYYAAAALSNMAVHEKHRYMMVAIGRFDVLKQLIKLLGASREKVCWQSCLALRNLASDADNQVLIVQLKCLPRLHTVIKHSQGDMLAAAVACLRNLSIHKANENAIVQQTFLQELPRVVRDSRNTWAQVHAAGTIRNLAAGDLIQRITESGCVEALVDVLLLTSSKVTVMVEVTAALAILADEDDTRQKLLKVHNGSIFKKLVTMATESDNSEIGYNCAGIIGQMSLLEMPAEVLSENTETLLFYLRKFLVSRDPSHIHIALWTLTQLLRFDPFLLVFKESELVEQVKKSSSSSDSPAIQELAETVLKKV